MFTAAQTSVKTSRLTTGQKLPQTPKLERTMAGYGMWYTAPARPLRHRTTAIIACNDHQPCTTRGVQGQLQLLTLPGKLTCDSFPNTQARCQCGGGTVERSRSGICREPEPEICFPCIRAVSYKYRSEVVVVEPLVTVTTSRIAEFLGFESLYESPHISLQCCKTRHS